jgi:hypothetical protein
MRKVLALIFVLTCCSVFSSAQQQKPGVPDKWDVFGGYSLSHGYVANETPFPLTLNGGQASGTYYFTRHFGATAEFAAYTDDADSITFHTQGYLFGPSGRFGFKNGKYQRMSFFAHQLFGVTHISLKSDTDTTLTETTKPFTMVSGGGMDFKLSRHISIRPLQMEYFEQQISVDSLETPASVRTGARSFTSPDTGLKLSTDGFRYTAGAVFHF